MVGDCVPSSRIALLDECRHLGVSDCAHLSLTNEGCVLYAGETSDFDKARVIDTRGVLAIRGTTYTEEVEMVKVKEAALKAFDFVAEMETVVRQDTTMEEFLDSSDVAVESARHDQLKGVWVIGIGFVRPWGRIKSTASIFSGHPEGVAIRTVKTVTISDETGEVLDYE